MLLKTKNKWEKCNFTHMEMGDVGAEVLGMKCASGTIASRTTASTKASFFSVMALGIPNFCT